MQLLKTLSLALLPFMLLASEIDLNFLAKELFQHECTGRRENLAFWSPHEKFPSLGIGHFIWQHDLPKHNLYEDQFPDLLLYLETKGETLPSWLKIGPCPWHSKEAFDSDTLHLQQLREFLWQTRTLQASFVVNRFDRNLLYISHTYPDLDTRILALKNHPYGYYAMLDYSHFKGEGIVKLTHNHPIQGSGLVEVLYNMSLEGDPLEAFVKSAETLLRKRVDSTQHRGELRFLSGWLARIHSYLKMNERHTSSSRAAAI